MGYQTFDRHGLALDIVVVGAEHADEGPLCPMIVFGVAGAYLAVPIERETDLVQLLTVAGNILHGGDGGVLPRLYSILLGRESVGIVTHGVEYVVALRALVAGIDVRGDVAQRMAHMEARPRGVREHVEHIKLLLLRVLGYAISLIGYPSLLPFLLYFSEIIFHICGFICFCFPII